MINAIKQFFLTLQLGIWKLFQATKTSLAEERGDTNFISIAIILVIVIAVAVAFIAFKDQILGLFSTSTSDLVSKLGG